MARRFDTDAFVADLIRKLASDKGAMWAAMRHATALKASVDRIKTALSAVTEAPDLVAQGRARETLAQVLTSIQIEFNTVAELARPIKTVVAEVETVAKKDWTGQ